MANDVTKPAHQSQRKKHRNNRGDNAGQSRAF